MEEQIQIQNLQFEYQSGKPVLDIPKLTIPLHQLILLHGPSGSGKSTLLKIIAGLLPRYGGHLTGEVNIPDHLQSAIMFQDPGTQFALDTPRHEIEFALENLQTPSNQIPTIVNQALATAGITKFADRQFTTLSGGEQQRATLAVIIAMQRQIILLDEPFASLDSDNRDVILQQLIKLRDEGRTIIIADHELAAYRELTPLIISFQEPIRLLTSEERQRLLMKAGQLPVIQTKGVPASNESSAITLSDLTIQRAQQPLLQQPSLIIPKNQVTLITGPSGSGKSTFLKTVMKLVPYQGSLSLFGKNVQHYSRKQIGATSCLVFQNATDQFLNVTVEEEVALSLQHGQHPYFTAEHLEQTLTKLQLNHLKHQSVYRLSGGQKKKLQLLVMLMMGHPLLLLDEPFSGLDQRSIAAVVQLIQQSRQVLPQTIVLVSHQLTGLGSLVDYHLQLADHQFKYVKGVQPWIPVSNYSWS